MRVRSLVIISDGGGNLIKPVIEASCQTIKKPKSPKIGKIISWECFRQNLLKELLEPLRTFKVVAIALDAP